MSSGPSRRAGRSNTMSERIKRLRRKVRRYVETLRAGGLHPEDEESIRHELQIAKRELRNAEREEER